eukprot:Blabericola_migrator_1__8798@NODE_4640_length_1048_cov_11_540265_g2886_i0_p3_GENE_NODE_4640_length_1048_cov_11_540265_g2886_i0NODE_4640_length_1048_cov_11_540265_g2886_i0_p3_ORF_typecomplete_len100_score16_72_NODE_4640_length_1048_cov_11_540265_g2886_i0458757
MTEKERHRELCRRWRSLSLTELNLSEIESNMRTLHVDPSLHLIGTSDETDTPVIATATNRPTRRALPNIAKRATAATPPTPEVPKPVLRNTAHTIASRN